ncbi:katanin [Trypanosoma rangeli SC58]|uniref:Katanin p60 ATPase-containing subunit A-like 2 n=1 Tax=Trypanosoma rangeli SC58 TaxID=429131 RepID=A0A061IYE0_TRYRA|nr:katanin [Trypanosoma rangeli SC58]
MSPGVCICMYRERENCEGEMQQRNFQRLQPLSNNPEGAPGSSLQAIKAQHKAREEDEKIRLKRVKGAIVLVLQFLLDRGYTGALQMLQQESHVSLQQFCPADNIDLLTIITEYEHYFEFRFNRRVKLFRAIEGAQDVLTETYKGECMAVRCRRTASSGTPQMRPAASVNPDKVNYATVAELGSAPPSGVQETQRFAGKPSPIARGLALASKSCPPHSPQLPRGTNQKKSAWNANGPIAVEGTRVDVVRDSQDKGLLSDADDDVFFGRALKPLPTFLTGEQQELAMTIQRDILDVNPNVRWSDIAELDQAKQLLKEAVVMPVRYPELFSGIVRPWKGILLFGPPGTGKTLLAKAVATECRTTFFNISASSVVSKWRGDSEKLVRLLFDLAVHYAPSTIFIDEIDSLMSARSGEGMHEGSRRMKTELLIQMDGLSKRRGGEVVFVLAASNVPWDLDTAMLRRLEKRILVGLPSHEARAALFRTILTPNVAGPDLDWNLCANLTEGMSGADIDVVCREAMMRPIRLLIEKLESAGNPMQLAGGTLQRPRVTIQDVMASVACTQSSVRQSDLGKFDEWARRYGSGVSS